MGAVALRRAIGSRAEFPLQDGIVQLNHASYGISTVRTLELASRLRETIEQDPVTRLGSELEDRLLEITTATAGWLGLSSGSLALTNNATSGAAAVVASMPLARDDVVVALAAEYSSIVRAWEVQAERVGARFVQVDFPLPLRSSDEVIAALDAQVGDALSILQVSLVSSSAALRLPIPEIGAWVRSRGGTLVVDAAHGPGHVPVADLADNADVVFGTLHKWLPLPRGVGFIWVSDAFGPDVRPAEVSLNWDSADFASRFSWPGTFDPVPRLCLPDAIEQWNVWDRGGLIAGAESLAEETSSAIEGLGAVPTGHDLVLAPRLRAFILTGVSLPELDATLDDAGIRAWTGSDTKGDALLRVSTHVFSDGQDLERLVAAVRSVMSAAATRTQQ